MRGPTEEERIKMFNDLLLSWENKIFRAKTGQDYNTFASGIVDDEEMAFLILKPVFFCVFANWIISTDKKLKGRTDYIRIGKEWNSDLACSSVDWWSIEIRAKQMLDAIS